MAATVADIRAWYDRDLGRFASWDRYVQIGPVARGFDFRIRFYTAEKCYSITAVGAGGLQPDGYLGCVATARKPRAGEQQHRGNDLADGPLDEATWHRIICDIVSYELVKVHGTTADVGLAEGSAAVRHPALVDAVIHDENPATRETFPKSRGRPT